MARKPRVHFSGALCHVIARGNQRQDIFLDDTDLQTYLTYLSENKLKFSLHLYAYALMKNHLHLLLEVNEVALSQAMQILQFRYTRYFNKRYKKVGHLFQGRYKAILCDKDRYLLELVRYIHLNPVRAGVVESPENYPWTGHLEYLGRGRGTWLTGLWFYANLGEDETISSEVVPAVCLGGIEGGSSGGILPGERPAVFGGG
jgi:putative transposase